MVTQETPLIILDSKYAIFVAQNGKDTRNTRKINRRVHLVGNDENSKIHNIDWCEGGIQLADIIIKNVGENYFNHRMKYIMLRL